MNCIDFFCGAGVGAIGFKQAGFEIIDAVDNNPHAIRTYNLNIGNHARALDVRKIKEDIDYADLYIGGIPCQPFSIGGSQRGFTDEKHGDLGYQFLRIVANKQPKVFLMENVKGMVFKKYEVFINWLLDNINDIGYHADLKLIDAFDYGVPQNRERVFIIGVRKDLKGSFRFPEPTEERRVLKDALQGLPEVNSQSGIRNHNQYYDGGYSSRYISRNRQRQWHEPSYTIVSQARQLPLYPEPPNYDIRRMDEYSCEPPRRFTVRECLRIQTVPDWFYFPDDIPLLKQYERCSGIPTLLAYKIGKEIEKLL